MHIISKRPFTDAATKHPNDKYALLDLYRALKKSSFKTPEEMKKVFKTLDNFKYKDKWYVLDVGGNNLRVIALIQFVNKRIYTQST
jgi:mRNA interferase HigB